MTHLPFLIPAYALGILLPGAYALAAWTRLAAARRRLAAIDPRIASSRVASRAHP